MTDTLPRSTRPGISIDDRDRWWYGPNPIVNPDVLAYFKLNLRREPDDGAYYIINRFGELLEHGFLDRVDGFPLIVETVLVTTIESANRKTELILELRLDSRESLTVPAAGLTIYDEHTLGLVLPKRNVPARLGPMAMGSLASMLEVTETITPDNTIENTHLPEYILASTSDGPAVPLQTGDRALLFQNSGASSSP